MGGLLRILFAFPCGLGAALAGAASPCAVPGRDVSLGRDVYGTIPARHALGRSPRGVAHDRDLDRDAVHHLAVLFERVQLCETAALDLVWRLSGLSSDRPVAGMAVS